MAKKLKTLKNSRFFNDYESVGWGFESLMARHLKPLEFQRSDGFLFCKFQQKQSLYIPRLLYIVWQKVWQFLAVNKVSCYSQAFNRSMGIDFTCNGNIAVPHELTGNIDRHTFFLKVGAIGVSKIIYFEILV